MNAYWMPFTALRDFLAEPRLLAAAEGHHYRTKDGRRLYDAFSGLWTSGLGHCHPAIVDAVQRQVAELDYAMGFQVSHPKAFELAERLVALAPDGLGSAFFTNSGSESVDTALKIALAYHRANGQPERTRLIGRARGYHGVNFGGMSVGGMPANRKVFSAALLPGVDHLPHTHDLEHNAFVRGQPQWGAHLADELERICAIHDGGNIAAVIVEPVAGSTGILPPPLGYLEKLRAICDRHGILLIFDEVITGFGRIGAPFAAQRFGVTPDLIVTAKGLTNGVIPMGAVIVHDRIRQAMMNGPRHVIELFHGYTYSAHPLACAAGLATLDLYRDEKLFERAKKLEPKWADAAMGLKSLPGVLDIRTLGLTAAIDLASRPDAFGKRAYEAMERAFHEDELMVRVAGETIVLTPPLIVSESQIGEMFEKAAKVIKAGA
jgi:beta-alanine--pyruvate transaminase